MKAVLFDLDETILDRSGSLLDFVLWQAKGMLRNSIDNVEDFCARFVELDANGTVWKDKVYKQLIAEYDIGDWSVGELLSSYELCFSGFCKPKEGAVESISKLRSHSFKLGLVSNGNSPFQERNFNSLGISRMFDSVIVSGAVGYRKPQKEIFELACKRIGVPPRKTVFVGDNPEADIAGANSCGMYTVYMPGRNPIDCMEADVICEHFDQLVQIVQNVI